MRSMNDDTTTYVEVTLPDGTVCRWAVEINDDTQNALTDAIENVIGAPATVIC